MKIIRGVITSEVKVIRFSPLLMHFSVSDRDGQVYHCLIHTLGLTFFAQATPGAGVELRVKENKRHQLIVQQFQVYNAAVLV